MPRMTDVDVDYISLVNKGANKQKIQIYKADDFEPETSDDNEIEEVTGFFNALKSFFTGSDDVKKADNKTVKSFKDRIVTSEVIDNIWRVNDTLVSTMRDVLNSPDIKDKETALKSTIDEHETYLKSKIKGVNDVKKSEEFFEKEGGNEEMKIEDLQEIVKEAVKPLNEKIETIEKELKPEGEGTKEGKDENDVKKEDTEGIAKEDISKAVKEAIKPMEERIEKIENFKGISKQLDDDGEPVKKSTSVFAGINI